jgi:hypothetical protein
MKAISRRLRKLEERHVAQRNEHGLGPADVLRQRMCRRQAAETGRPYEELLREREMESQAFWASYHGDRSIAGILRRLKSGEEPQLPRAAMTALRSI